MAGNAPPAQRPPSTLTQGVAVRVQEHGTRSIHSAHLDGQAEVAPAWQQPQVRVLHIYRHQPIHLLLQPAGPQLLRRRCGAWLPAGSRGLRRCRHRGPSRVGASRLA